MSGTAIQVDGLGKRYLLGEQTDASVALRELLTRRGRRVRAHGESREFWALRDVSFDVDQGDVVGIVGANGAGKSTLLKILARITEPTEGRVRMRGRVGALLEVGTAFHEELTGRENIWINGTLLGMSRGDIQRHFDEIVAFAGVERFLDTPIKRYSSGMYLRLAFSVAAHLEPEIVIIDEVLAVGDADFQRRCLAKMRELAADGRTVLFVSHDANAVGQLCPRVVWLDQGRVREEGPTARVLGSYLHAPVVESHAVRLPVEEAAPASVLEVELVDGGGAPVDLVEHGDPLHVRVRTVVREPLQGREVAVWIAGPDGTRVIDEAVLDEPALTGALDREGTYDLVLHLPPVLPPGDHALGVWLGADEEELIDQEVLRFTVASRVGDREFANPRRRAASPVVSWTVTRA